MDFIDVMDRVSLVVEKKIAFKPTDRVIADYLNISPTNYANMKKRNKIPYEEIAYFSQKSKISMNWILFNEHCENLVKEEEKYYTLKIIDKINASCGGGTFEYEEIEIGTINLDKSLLKSFGYNSANNLAAIKVIGDSMFPILNENDLVLIDKSLTKFKSDNIYLVNTNDGLFIKKLIINENENTIDLISENQNYSNMTLTIDEVKIMGRILGVLEENIENTDKKDKIKENQIDDDFSETNEQELEIDIEFSKGYTEFVDGKYESFIPDKDTWKYGFEDNQYYVIEILSDIYDALLEKGLSQIEPEEHSLRYDHRNEKYYELFLFKDGYDYEYEISKLEEFKNNLMSS